MSTVQEKIDLMNAKKENGSKLTLKYGFLNVELSVITPSFFR